MTRENQDLSFGQVVRWTIGLALLFTLLSGGLTWIVQGNDFFLYKVFAPAQENVRREVFENTKSYNQGMVQELQNMQFEHVKASDEHKKALASVILQRSADFPEDKMPNDLRVFISDLKRQRGLSQ